MRQFDKYAINLIKHLNNSILLRFNSSKKGSNTLIEGIQFPCVDQILEKTKNIQNTIQNTVDEGPEPFYHSKAVGYKTFRHEKPFKLDLEDELPNFELAYETWGKLNKTKSNAILLFGGLSASSHAKSHKNNDSKGWWESVIGNKMAIDTDKYFVICCNVLGGCYGSTGPSSMYTEKERYASRFPLISLFDIVRAQMLLIDHLKIDKLHAVVGASMGGMQALIAAALFPDRTNRLICISACSRAYPYSIAFRHVQRQILMSDPNFNKGFFYGKVPPHTGMKLARELGTITYRSGLEWEKRFSLNRIDKNKKFAFCADYLIEGYLDHQGEKFSMSYDANSFIYLSKAMDMFSMSIHAILDLKESSKLLKIKNNNFQNQKHDKESLVLGLQNIKHPSLVIGVQSDVLFPSWQQKEIADCIAKNGNSKVNYIELTSIHGHDTFLIDQTSIPTLIKGHLELT